MNISKPNKQTLNEADSVKNEDGSNVNIKATP